MNSLSRSTGVISRSTRQLYYKPAAFLHVSSVFSRETVVDKAKHMADTVNKQAGKKITDVIEGAEHVTEAAADKTKGLKHDVNKHSEKTIVNTIIDGVESVKQAVGLGSKEAGHAADEAKDEAKLKAKKAANFVDESTDQASKYAKDAKSKASDFAQEAKEKASDAAEGMKGKH
ncbi:unnamed protein product [Rhizopus stolonifer]